MRDWCGLGKLETIDELALAVGNHSAYLMMDLYESIDDIDLYSGGLSELPTEPGTILGPTFSCIVAQQFSLLRHADRYWYESSNGPHSFTPQQLASIKETTLARIVCANSDQIWTIQPLAMRLPHPVYNPLVNCQDLPDLDMSLWVELVAGQQPAAVDADDGNANDNNDDDTD
jgi:peroxidase